MEFEKRLAADVRDGFAPPRMHLEVQATIGMHLVLHEQAVQAGTFPPQSIGEWPLERLCDLGDFWGMCLELDIPWEDTRDAWVALRLTECLAHLGPLSIQDLMSLSSEDFVLLVQEGVQVGRVWFWPTLRHLRWLGERYAQGKTVSVERFFHHPFGGDWEKSTSTRTGYRVEIAQHDLQTA